MKIKSIQVGVLSLVLVAGFLVSAVAIRKNSSLYEPRKDHENASLSGEKRSMVEAAEWLFRLRRDPVTNTVPIEAQVLARQEVMFKSMQKSGALGLDWENLGPENQGGRTRALLIDNRDTTGKTLYTGGVCGGLWRSANAGATWDLISDDWENIAVVSICQEPGGKIYVGTGELLLAVRGVPGTGNSSCIGSGIWTSDDGLTFTRLAATDPNPTPQNNSANDEFAYTYALAYSATHNKLYAGTNKGLRVSDNHGVSFTNPIAGLAACRDVEAGNNGLVLASVGNKCYRSTDGSSFLQTHLNSGGTTTPSLSNLQISISSQDENYAYCIGAAGNFSTAGVWKSTDRGASWTNIYPPSAPVQLNILNQQGDYACAIGVDAFNKDHVICGGLDLYGKNGSGSWTQLSAWNYNASSALYCHADHHNVVFDKYNPGRVYFVNDGGVFRSNDGGITFSALNRNYRTLQLYSIAASKYGEVLGGSQDNGTHLIDYVSGPTASWSNEVIGGDGFDVEFSNINPGASFGSLYYGDLRRATNLGGSYADFYSGAPTALVDASPFHTVIRMWESFNNPASLDVVNYVVPAGVTIAPNQTFTAISRTSFYPFTATNNSSTTYVAGDTIFGIKDIVQSRLSVAMGFGTTAKIFMATRPLDFSRSPYWMPIANSTVIDGDVSCMAYSSDGDLMYYTTQNGSIYRISGLNTIKSNTDADTLTGRYGHPNCQLNIVRIGKVASQVATSVAVDPNDKNRIIVTCGNYNANTYVYKSTNAATAGAATDMTTNFTSTQTNLPKMPVYSSLIDYTNGNRFILGTEYGIWTSDNAGASWSFDNDGMANCQVFMLRQQTLPYNMCWNSGHIYAATHGRGFYRTRTLTGTKELAGNTDQNLNILIYPNPSSDQLTFKFQLEKSERVDLSVYDLQGKLVLQTPWGERPQGNNVIQMENNNLSDGTYLAAVSTASGKRIVSKFVIRK